MMRWDLLIGLRRASVIALLSLLSVFSASAAASDPLLSGYAGPGGGEQVVIGTKVLPAPSGDGSLRQVTPPADSSSSDQQSTKQKSKPKAADTDSPTTKGAKPLYPVEASTASAMPLAQGELLALLIAAGTVGLIAFFFRRNGSTGQ